MIFFILLLFQKFRGFLSFFPFRKWQIMQLRKKIERKCCVEHLLSHFILLIPSQFFKEGSITVNTTFLDFKLYNFSNFYDSKNLKMVDF